MTNVMTKTTSRQKILAYLRTHNGVTSAEMARSLQVTPANMRYHLSHLAADGRVKIISLRQDGRGRPVKVYGLSDALVGDNLAGLADVVLSKLLAGFPVAERESVLGALAAQLAASTPPERTLHITRRLALTIERLNALHYQSRWEAHAQGPRVILEHCPYAAILAKHPELCRMDGFLLQDLLGTATEQSAKLELNARGLPFCMFVVGR